MTRSLAQQPEQPEPRLRLDPPQPPEPVHPAELVPQPGRPAAAWNAVVTQCRARRGVEVALSHLLVHTLRLHLGAVAHAQEGWVLQGVDDPQDTLSVHECPDLLAFQGALAADNVRRRLAELATGPLSHHPYRSYAFYENMAVKPAHVTGLRLEVPPERATILEQAMRLAIWPKLKTLPELVLRVAYQDTAAPHRFLLVHGWRSAAAHEDARPAIAARTHPTLTALGARWSRLIARP